MEDTSIPTTTQPNAQSPETPAATPRTIPCGWGCGSEIVEGAGRAIDGGVVICQDCFDESEICVGCERRLSIDSVRTARLETGDLAQYCYLCIADGGFFECMDCGGLFDISLYAETEENGEGGDAVCRFCANNDGGVSYREYDPEVKDFQNKEKGGIITSQRKFGVELEVIAPEAKDLRGLSNGLKAGFGFTTDGSIRGNGYGVEIQTPVLAGKAGEDVVVDVCAALQKNNCTTNDSCGMHVHLDGEDFLPPKVRCEVISYRDYVANVKKIADNGADRAIFVKRSKTPEVDLLVPERLDEMEYQFVYSLANTSAWIPAINSGDGYISATDIGGVGASENKKPPKKKVKPVKGYLARLKGFRYPVEIREMIDLATQEGLPISPRSKMPSDCIDDLRSLIRGPEEHVFEIDETWLRRGFVKDGLDDIFVVVCYENGNYQKIKTLLYAFVAFDQILAGMLPLNRRQKNDYCKRMNLAFSPYDIEALSSHDEIEDFWYKTTDKVEIKNRKAQKRDRSRYFGLNLHSLFSDNRTIEIRFHSGVVEAEKALNWVAIHQHILDRISRGEITIGHLRQGIDLFSHKDKLLFFLGIFRFPKNLEEYIISRTRHFLKIKV